MKTRSFPLLIVALPLAMVRAQTMTCPASSDKSARLRTEVVEYASSPEAADFRADIGLTITVDTSTIAVVITDSLCDAVTRGINAAAQTPRTSSMIVVKFGSFYAACDPSGPMITSVYILDDHFRLLTVMAST